MSGSEQNIKKVRAALEATEPRQLNKLRLLWLGSSREHCEQNVKKVRAALEATEPRQLNKLKLLWLGSSRERQRTEY